MPLPWSDEADHQTISRWSLKAVQCDPEQSRLWCDPDAVFARALEAGGEQLYEVTDHDYGERSGGVRDPFGNSWYLARVTDMAKRLPNQAQ